MLERSGEEMAFHVMDADQRNSTRKCQRLSVAHPDQQRTDQAWSVRDRYRVEIIEFHSRLIERAIDHGNDAGQMRARRDLRDHAAEYSMNILGKNHQRFLHYVIATAFQHRGGCLVTRCLDSENPHHTLPASRFPLTLSVRRADGPSTRARRANSSPSPSSAFS